MKRIKYVCISAFLACSSISTYGHQLDSAKISDKVLAELGVCFSCDFQLIIGHIKSIQKLLQDFKESGNDIPFLESAVVILKLESSFQKFLQHFNTIIDFTESWAYQADSAHHTLLQELWYGKIKSDSVAQAMEGASIDVLKANLYFVKIHHSLLDKLIIAENQGFKDLISDLCLSLNRLSRQLVLVHLNFIALDYKIDMDFMNAFSSNLHFIPQGSDKLGLTKDLVLAEDLGYSVYASAATQKWLTELVKMIGDLHKKSSKVYLSLSYAPEYLEKEVKWFRPKDLVLSAFSHLYKFLVKKKNILFPYKG